MPSLRRAVFLDRDGVLVDDQGFLVREDQIRLLEGVATALASLKAAGWLLVVVTNQAAVARGLITEQELIRINLAITERIERAGGPPLDAIYYCPHHPEADLDAYRVVCTCRKPRPGMLVRAAEELGLDTPTSVLVGDRMTDVAAGAAGGCRTVLVTCGRHADPSIVGVDSLKACRPDHVCADLKTASDWILGQL